MSRPYIILHMLTSLDGRATGAYLESEKCAEICEDYYRIHREYKSEGFICGRITMESSFTGNKAPDLQKFIGKKVKKEDSVAKKAQFYAVSIDPRGVVGWYDADISDSDEGYDKAHIIEVLTKLASDEYIAFLQEKGISYIFCGEREVDVCLMCEKLYTLFGIGKIMLEGGGKTDTAFLENDLIDELSLVLCPMADTDKESVGLFSKKSGTGILREFSLKEVKTLKNDALWLNYERKKEC